MQVDSMGKRLIIVLKAAIVLLAILTLGWLVLFPQVEGRNANSDSLSLYFNDPFLAYVYVGSIPFFVMIFQTIKLLSYADKKRIFSNYTLKALKIIKYCSALSISFIIGAVIILVFGPEDDKPPIIGIGTLLIAFHLFIVAAANSLQRIIERRIS
jgi:hypothetical protein